MKPPPATKPEVQATKLARRTLGGSVLGWIADQLRSALKISSSQRLGNLSDRGNSSSTEENATPPKTPGAIHFSINENAAPNSSSTGQRRVELHVPAQTFRPATSQPSSNAVTRDELKRELDTLRRVIENRK